MGKMEFAAWMFARRTELRPVPSQQAIAEIIGVSQETVSKWEKVGVGELSPRRIRRIASCYHADPVVVARLLDYPTVAPTTKLLPARTRQEEMHGLIEQVVRLNARIVEMLPLQSEGEDADRSVEES